jgi:hypothetical protein
VNALTIAELRLRHAQLTEKAERERQKWQNLPPTPGAIRLGKEIKQLQQRADDYGRLLDAVAGWES